MASHPPCRVRIATSDDREALRDIARKLIQDASLNQSRRIENPNHYKTCPFEALAAGISYPDSATLVAEIDEPLTIKQGSNINGGTASKSSKKTIVGAAYNMLDHAGRPFHRKRPQNPRIWHRYSKEHCWYHVHVS